MAVPPIPDLGQLIAEGRGEGKAVQTSYAELAKAAGGVPTTTRFHQLRKLGVVDPKTGRSELKQAPEADSVRGIAQALGYSDWTVWRSAGVSLGIKPPPDPADIPVLARLMRLPLDKLAPSEVDVIVQMARTMLADR